MSANAFEAYPEIAGPMQKLANTQLDGWTLREWDAFCAAISRLTADRDVLKGRVAELEATSPLTSPMFSSPKGEA